MIHMPAVTDSAGDRTRPAINIIGPGPHLRNMQVTAAGRGGAQARG